MNGQLISGKLIDKVMIIQKNANTPHFHLQMVVDGFVLLKFYDFHIPLSVEDILNFRLIKEAPDKVLLANPFGAGMSILGDDEHLEQLNRLMYRIIDWDKAPFHTSSLIQMPEGESMAEEILEKKITQKVRKQEYQLDI
ncbi:hypothetical protein [Rufibacter ruber]|uniref:hypothetical protein n=1 Tax=Rufibacter ruber TaxID=1783499 RepID=UPI00082FE4E2|nr:hypothetical protein [Rufibacter ruber]